MYTPSGVLAVSTDPIPLVSGMHANTSRRPKPSWEFSIYRRLERRNRYSYGVILLHSPVPSWTIVEPWQMLQQESQSMPRALYRWAIIGELRLMAWCFGTCLDMKKLDSSQHKSNKHNVFNMFLYVYRVWQQQRIVARDENIVIAITFEGFHHAHGGTTKTHQNVLHL